MFFRMGRESIVEQNGAAVYSAYPKDDVGDASLNQSYLYSLLTLSAPTCLAA